MAKLKNQEITLKVLKVCGLGVLILAVSMLSPTFPYLILKAYLKKRFRKSYSDMQLRNAVKYIKRRKFIAYKNKKVVLTKLGKIFLKRHFILNELSIKKVPWDNKWRVISFDIPNEKLSSSHIFRAKLKQLGFFHFQRSVFIIPFPCEKEVSRLSEELEIEEYVHILITERFRNDRLIVKKFKL
jgi:DNA-binding transcriptional regulator PaaX